MDDPLKIHETFFLETIIPVVDDYVNRTGSSLDEVVLAGLLAFSVLAQMSGFPVDVLLEATKDAYVVRHGACGELLQ